MPGVSERHGFEKPGAELGPLGPRDPPCLIRACELGTFRYNWTANLAFEHFELTELGVGNFPMETFLRFGMLVDVGKICAESGHPYSMTSAYTPDPNEFSFTLRGAAGHCHMLDQIWFDSTRSHCQAGWV